MKKKRSYTDPYEYEQHVAQLLGGRREIASGAISGDYDVTSGSPLPHIVDCKVTTKGSFSVNHKTFDKIRARSMEHIPAMFIHMSEAASSYVVVREEDYAELVRLASERMEE